MAVEVNQLYPGTHDGQTYNEQPRIIQFPTPKQDLNSVEFNWSRETNNVSMHYHWFKQAVVTQIPHHQYELESMIETVRAAKELMKERFDESEVNYRMFELWGEKHHDEIFEFFIKDVYPVYLETLI